METAKVIKTIDWAYKNGFAQCQCGWRQYFENGFNEYHIERCPECSDIEIRHQRKVTYGSRNNYTVEIGDNYYFVLSNGIHVRFKQRIYNTYTGLSESQADRL